MNISRRDLADTVSVSCQHVNGKRGTTSGTALQLSGFFNVSPDFGIPFQICRDLYGVQLIEENELASTEDFHHFSENNLTHVRLLPSTGNGTPALSNGITAVLRDHPASFDLKIQRITWR